MIKAKELKEIVKARLRDAEALYRNNRYDGAVYLCGYSIEVALKARICRTLKWDGFPSTKKEFQDYQSFKTHSLDVLLSLCGLELKIKTDYMTEWSDIVSWDPEVRYKPIGSASRSDAFNMIESAKVLLKVL